ncbi:MAG: hypothetical protein H0U23_00930 [Blastocatellia bacterium]|nr:hypothetical protein [Blastocatellia bacterium]
MDERVLLPCLQHTAGAQKHSRQRIRREGAPHFADKIGEVVVAFPTSIPEQTKIVSTLAALATETQRLETHYAQKQAALAALKKSLLNQAFTGAL